MIEVMSSQAAIVIGGVVMGLAISGMHYTGMAAARFPEGSICGAALGGSGISPTWLASLVGATTFAILGLALVTSILDRRLQERTAQLGESLQKANQELTYLALHDTLTKLPNRLLLRDRMENAIRRAVRHGRRFAVLFVDLDGFKAVNDTHGHAAGDRVLEQAQAATFIEGDAPAVLVRPGLAASLHEAGEAEHDIGGHVGAHAKQLAHASSPDGGS